MWAFAVAINDFFIVWTVHPFLKLSYTWVRAFGAVWRVGARIGMDPIMEAFGQCFAFMKGKFSLSVTGMPQYRPGPEITL